MVDQDVIVIGAGSAGAVVARRLVDAGARVLLLEAGGRDRNPAIHDPGRSHELWLSGDDWCYRTVPQPHAGDRAIHLPRGKVLGGSSALNGMIYVRGWRGDFDGWARAGNPGWAYDDVLPLFKRSEDFDAGADAYHGAGGPLPVLSRYEPHPVHAAIIAAGQELGLPYNADPNGASLDGIGPMQLTIRDGVRQSTATAFLAPIAERPELTVVTRAHARKLLFAGSRCVGVEYERGRAPVRAYARHEVVVCAGAYDSPKLLLLSGLGPAAELRRHGIAVRADLAGVGANLQDHTVCSVIFGAPRAVPPPAPGLPEMQSHLFWRSRSGLAAPDVQPIHFCLPLYEPWMRGPEHGYTLRAGVIRPAGRGTVRLASADPAAAPLIDPRYLTERADLDAMVAAVELCRELGRQPALRAWTAAELYPGREPLVDYVRRAISTYHHPAGTCAMGSVVDAQLRVHGVDGLRVADASVMPDVTTGNTHAPTVMIGERAAELVAAALAA